MPRSLSPFARVRVRFAVACAVAAVSAPAVLALAPTDVAAATPPSTIHPLAGQVAALRTDTQPVSGQTVNSAVELLALTDAQQGAPSTPSLRFAAAGEDPFVAVGFSWNGPQAPETTLVITYADGTHSPPIDLSADDSRSDAAAAGSARIISDPVALDRPAVGYSFVTPITMRDVQVHLIRESGVVPLVQRALADGIPGPDGIHSRESWGARPRKPTEPCAPSGHPEGLGCVADAGVLNAVVHHTVNANDYAASSVPAMLRSIQAFHQDVQGFDDIGYNMLVDRFGGMWEGRAGGVDRPVVGGHTMGFNTGSVGVAVLGTFDTVAPNDAVLDSVANLIAWKFAQRNVDPFGQLTVISNGGDIHPEGQAVVLDTITGHRGIGATSCPGVALFERIPDIRQRVAARMPLYTGEVDFTDRGAGNLRVEGFALRRDTVTPVAVSLRVDGAIVAQTVANIGRFDVAGRFGALGGAHGFSFTIPLASTMRQACVTENLTGTLIGCRDVYPVTPPFGDWGVTTSVNPPAIGLSGWAIDPDTSEPTVAHVYLDGQFTQLWADRSRPDVAAIYPRYGVNRGFAATLPTTRGAHQLCVWAINVPAGAHTSLGCREVVVGSANRYAPTGSLDLAAGGGASVLVAGWAFDRDITGPLNVHVYVDNALTPIVAGNDRPDVAAVLPGAPVRSGFSARVPASPGAHTVCVYAIDANLVGPHTLLGCRAVTVLAANATPPTGVVDVMRAGTGNVFVAGWAIDPDTSAPIEVHVYVDATGTVANAGVMRSDLASAFPQYGGQHGFSVTVAAGRGTHQVCAYAINNLARGENTLLGCQRLTVS